MILDTSIWVALLDEDDSCHHDAAKIIADIHPEDLHISDYIYCEILTVLRRKNLEFMIRELINFISDFNIKVKFIDQDLFNLASSLFLNFEKLSFTDCAILATAKFNREKLFTFDKQLEKAYQKILD